MTEIHRNIGHFVWRELIADDVEKAKGFYGELFGWTFAQMPMGDGGDYTVILAGGRHIGGMMPPPMPGLPTHWMSYLSVEDVDAALARVKAAGGSLAAGPMDISVGRLAVVADPAGAHFVLWRANEGDGGPAGMPQLGEFCWETLVVPAQGDLEAFYGQAVGWTRGTPPGPDQDMLVFNAGGQPVADVQVTTMGAPPHWLTYVVVAEADAAREKAARLGANVLVPLIEVPNVGRIALIMDPQGGVIGLFQPSFAGQG